VPVVLFVAAGGAGEGAAGLIITFFLMGVEGFCIICAYVVLITLTVRRAKHIIFFIFISLIDL
jgi:hypothetical protein